MNTSDMISTTELNQILRITLCDQSRHYFGGYFHVKVLAYCDVPVLEHYFDSNSEFVDARNRMGISVRFERVLEKMAVPENEKESVRGKLIDSFNKTTLGYISAPDFAKGFIHRSYLNHINKAATLRFPDA